MSTFARYSDAVAAGDSNQTYRFMQDLDQRLDQIDRAVGGIQKSFVDSPADASVSTPPPAPAAFEVIGIDGKYKVAILNPQDINPSSPLEAQFRFNNSGANSSGTPILHNLQSATTTAFDGAGGVTDYGVSSQLSYEFQDPNQTKFFRLRSSYDGQNWNAWQIYSSAVTCGPVGVQSGALRSEAIVPNGQTNATNFATVSSTDNGTNATITVDGPGGALSSFQRLVGSSMVGPDGTSNTFFPAARLPGFAYDSDFKVYFNTSTLQYVVLTTAQFSQSIPNELVWIGTLHTVKAGGAGGTSGGGQGTGNDGGSRYATL